MKRTKFTRVAAFFLAALMMFGTFTVGSSAASIATNGTTAEELASNLSSTSYSSYLAKHSATGAEKDQTFSAVDTFDVNESSSGYAFAELDGREAVILTADGTAVFNINVEEAGLYAIGFDYYAVTEYAELGIKTSNSAIERIFYLNGKVPFSEARNLSMTKTWSYQYEVDEEGNSYFKEDIGGNQLRPDAVQSPVWSTYNVHDADGFYTEPFRFYLEAGNNVIALEGVKSAVALSEIRIFYEEGILTHEEYYKNLIAAGYKPASDAATIKIEAEMPVSVSDTSIYAGSDTMSPGTSPQSASAQLRNVIGDAAYDTVGQWAKYNITVSESGLYKIAARFKQSEQSGIFCSRLIKINGEVPFVEAYNTRFDYDSSWQLSYLGDGTQDFVFYFEEGKTYELTMEVSLGEMASILESVSSSLSTINEAYLEILKLTGTEPDKNRDYEFNRIMPHTIRSLLVEYKDLSTVVEYLKDLCGGAGSSTGTLIKIADLLYRMGSNEDKIASNLTNLKSYIGTLGTWINDTKSQPIVVDYYLVAPADLEKLPKADKNFFQAFGFQVKSFVMTFFKDYDTMGATVEVDVDNSIEVWLADGRDQTNAMRSLIDKYFMSQTGIGVNLKLVIASTLLPSVLADKGPDTYLGLTGLNTLNYAIRSAVLPLDEFSDLEEVLTQFPDAAVDPLQLYGKTYGLPKNLNFYMMFYRTDILADLGVDVPTTWDDLMTAVPVLQANNMAIGLTNNATGSAATETSLIIYDILLYQRGGSRWDTTLEDEGLRLGLSSDVALDAFNYLCRFFTMYSFAVKFDAANRFRTGEYPIIIDDYRTLYNKLIVFATEIRGLWSIAPVPGTVLEDGTINNNSIATVTGVIMLNGVENKQDTWTFMKWFVSPDIQAGYGNEMVALIGPSAKYNTANLSALESLDWSANELYNLQKQVQNLSSVINYPGNYIVARYEKFAFLAAENEGEDPVEQLQTYVVIINKEISRKRQEFDLPTYEDYEASLGQE